LLKTNRNNKNDTNKRSQEQKENKKHWQRHGARPKIKAKICTGNGLHKWIAQKMMAQLNSYRLRVDGSGVTHARLSTWIMFRIPAGTRKGDLSTEASPKASALTESLLAPVAYWQLVAGIQVQELRQKRGCCQTCLGVLLQEAHLVS